MTETRQHEQNSGLPKGLGKPAVRALHGAGYFQLEQLAGAREEELLKLHGMGPKAMGQLRSALLERGWSFAEPEKGE